MPDQPEVVSYFDSAGDPMWLPRVAESERGVMVCGGFEFPIASITLHAASEDGDACIVRFETERIHMPPGYWPGGVIEMFDSAGRLAWVRRRTPIEGGVIAAGCPLSLQVDMDVTRNPAWVPDGDLVPLPAHLADPA